MQRLDILMDNILVVNGIYDIACTCSILWLDRFPFFNVLSSLHPGLFEKDEHKDHPVIRRLLAYWLLTYGAVRTTTGFHRDPALDALAGLTYFIEAFCFAYELWVGGTMIHSKVTFVSVSSLAIGIFVLCRPITFWI